MVRRTNQADLTLAPAIRSIGIGDVVIGIAPAGIATMQSADEMAVVTIAATNSSAIGAISIAGTPDATMAKGTRVERRLLATEQLLAIEQRDHHRESIKMSTRLASSRHNCVANGEIWGQSTSRDPIDDDGCYKKTEKLTHLEAPNSELVQEQSATQ